MEAKKTKFRVENFSIFQKDIKSFFKSIIGLNEEGEFLEELDEDSAKQKIALANNRWTGERLKMKKC